MERLTLGGGTCFKDAFGTNGATGGLDLTRSNGLEINIGATAFKKLLNFNGVPGRRQPRRTEAMSPVTCSANMGETCAAC